MEETLSSKCLILHLKGYIIGLEGKGAIFQKGQNKTEKEQKCKKNPKKHAICKKYILDIFAYICERSIYFEFRTDRYNHVSLSGYGTTHNTTSIIIQVKIPELDISIVSSGNILSPPSKKKRRYAKNYYECLN